MKSRSAEIVIERNNAYGPSNKFGLSILAKYTTETSPKKENTIGLVFMAIYHNLLLSPMG